MYKTNVCTVIIFLLLCGNLWNNQDVSFGKSAQVHVIFINIRKPEKIVHLRRLAVCPGCMVSNRK